MMNEKITLKADFNVMATKVNNFEEEVKNTMHRMALGNYCTGTDANEFGDAYANYCAYNPATNDYIDITKVIYGAYDEDGNEATGLYGEIFIWEDLDTLKQIKGFAEYLAEYEADYVFDNSHNSEDDGCIILIDETSPETTYRIVAEIITLIINNKEAQAA